jgi:hypothetical protein
MVLYPGGRGPGADFSALKPVPTFYIDDTLVELGGIPHVLLAAVRFQNDALASAAVLRCKQALGIPLNAEVKWNPKKVTREQTFAIRGAMMPILSDASGTLVIHEGNKMDAARALAAQLSDYTREVSQAEGFVCRFDREIVEPTLFANDSKLLTPPCIGLSVGDSHLDPLLQAADLFVGYQKLRFDIGIGRVDGNKRIPAEVYEGEHDEYELSWYVRVGLRYCLWGVCVGDPDMPTKVNLGHGVRVFSSVSPDKVSIAISHLEEEYLGCIH